VVVAVLTSAASRLADLLAAARHVAEAIRLRVPGELAGMVQGLNAWALYLAAAPQGLGRGGNDTATGDGQVEGG